MIKDKAQLRIDKGEDGLFRIYAGIIPITEGAANPRQATVKLRYIAEQMETDACIVFDKKFD